MMKGTPGEWYEDDDIGGYYDDNGNFVCCWENGTDEDFDRYSVQVQNGEGYYDETGTYRRYRNSYD